MPEKAVQAYEMQRKEGSKLPWVSGGVGKRVKEAYIFIAFHSIARSLNQVSKHCPFSNWYKYAIHIQIYNTIRIMEMPQTRLK